MTDAELNAWERQPSVLNILISKEFGEWLHRRDKNKERRGEWILSDIQNEEDNRNDNYSYICSNCGHTDTHSRTVKVPFCWHCGADMRGEE